jgi:hypothetical protein
MFVSNYTQIWIGLLDKTFQPGDKKCDFPGDYNCPTFLPAAAAVSHFSPLPGSYPFWSPFAYLILKVVCRCARNKMCGCMAGGRADGRQAGMDEANSGGAKKGASSELLTKLRG